MSVKNDFGITRTRFLPWSWSWQNGKNIAPFLFEMGLCVECGAFMGMLTNGNLVCPCDGTSRSLQHSLFF